MIFPGETSLHRSARCISISALHVARAAFLACIVSTVVVLLGNTIVSGHSQLSIALLRAAGVPISSIQPDNLYRFGFLAINALRIETSSGTAASGLSATIAAGVVFLATLVGWRLPFVRGVAVATAIVVAIGVCTAFASADPWTTAYFSHTWVRLELALWIIMPWLAACILTFRLGAGVRLLSALVAFELYSICWSAIRMAAGIACIAAVGVGAVPLVFFAIGPICDLLSLLVFYSLLLR